MEKHSNEDILQLLEGQNRALGKEIGGGKNGTYCPLVQDRPYVVKNDILLEVPLLSTKYGGSGEDNSIQQQSQVLFKPCLWDEWHYDTVSLNGGLRTPGDIQL
ncbi:hypothetical protein ACLKA6_009724 [Drosophila palustris]